MAYKIFLDKEFDAPSDKVIFDQLVDRFKVAFKKEIKSEFHFLFGSLSLIGKEIDALYIHQNTVIAINFKPHSGKVEINANEEYWKVAPLLVMLPAYAPLPKLPAPLICSVPPLIVVPPV